VVSVSVPPNRKLGHNNDIVPIMRKDRKHRDVINLGLQFFGCILYIFTDAMKSFDTFHRKNGHAKYVS
jgi:hypothetical protein